MTDEQREKTIKCMLKVLGYQLEGIKDQAKDIEGHYKRTGKDLKDYEELLNKEENKIIMDDLKHKMKQT